MSAGRKVEIHQLVRDEMLAGRPFRCHVVSDSMSPIIRTGDRILVVPGPVRAFRVGDIVQVFHQDGAVTHRLMSWLHAPGCTCLITKGDRALTADQPWPSANVSGRVVAVDRGDRSLVLENRLWHALVSSVLVWEWRSLSALRNPPARRVLHWCCGLGVRALVRFAWFAAQTKAGNS